ncbi:MAG TPA: hypothetical protein VFE98_03065 [Candidatus Bathyarchaeia archaeon]|nr:hypothetical protein [Candidatus Bathyarchaeia archaeon]
MGKVEFVLAVGLYTSSILGIQLLLMDRWLWNASPTHAIGLALFVTVDVMLLAGMRRQTQLASPGALLVSLIQLGAMIADLGNGQPADVSSDSFRAYLLANTGFVSLMVVQAAILIVASMAVTSSLVSDHNLVSPIRGQ